MVQRPGRRRAHGDLYSIALNGCARRQLYNSQAGLYDSVLVLDYMSLYLSIIRAFLIDLMSEFF
ncbi:MAG: hypothetical protein Q8R69_27515 [Telluria sp.]|nr:hypothetical protein [Telluria sp.]